MQDGAVCCATCLRFDLGLCGLITSLAVHFVTGVADYAVAQVPHVNDVDAWQSICFGRHAQARVASVQQDNGAEVTHLTADICAKLMALSQVREWNSPLA